MKDFTKTIEEAEKVLEEYGTLVRRYESRENRRRIKKLYSNRRAMKKMIRKQENRLARNLEKSRKRAASDQDVSVELDMEWFLTWRLKLTDFPETMWCDGVEELQLTRKDLRSYSMQAKIWIGPEHDVNIEYLCDLIGTIMLSQNRQRLKSYRLTIWDKGKAYLLRKTT